jgi:hypothetical protein
VVDIAQNGLNWSNGLALAADVASVVIPGVTGAGALVRALTHVDDVVDAVKAVNRVGDAVDAVRTTENAGDAVQAANQASNARDVLASAEEVQKHLDDLATQATKNVDARGSTAFSDAQLADIANNSGHLPMHRGGAIHDELADLAGSDPWLANNKVNITTRGNAGPDFYRQGEWWDLTTDKSWQRHVRRYTDNWGQGFQVKYPQ